METITSANLAGENYRVIPTRQLSDNYAYLIIDNATNECAVVDVSEYGSVLDAIDANSAQCTAIFTTHHHAYDALNTLFLLLLVITLVAICNYWRSWEKEPRSMEACRFLLMAGCSHA
jgi:ABC-type transport system involved in cytochrome bd biosynthesis fused ATPase/permease subunit